MIFHRGVLEQYRCALDTASYGSFANLTATQGEQLIENLAQSDACYGGDYDRNVRDVPVDNLGMKELNEKMDRLSKAFFINQKHTSYVEEVDRDQQNHQEEVCEGSNRQQEEANYLGNQYNYQGSYQNRPYNPNYKNNNLSYRSQNVENPQDQYYPPQQPQTKPFQPRQFGNVSQYQNPQGRGQAHQGGFQFQNPLNSYTSEPKVAPQGQHRNNNNQFGQAGPSNQAAVDNDMRTMMRQIMESQASQARSSVELSEKMNKLERKVDGGYDDLQAKITDISVHMKTIDNQIAQVASSSHRPAGQLPGKPETNPKEFCKAITLRSGKELQTGDDEKDKEKEVD